MKKRTCHVPQCSGPCSLEPGSSGASPVCDVGALLLRPSHFAFSPIVSRGCLGLLWADFCPWVVCGPVWGHLGCERSQSRCLPEMQEHRTFSVLFPEKLCWCPGPAVTQGSAPSPLPGPCGTGVCGCLPLRPGLDSLWSGAGPCRGCWRPGLQPRFGCAPAKSTLDEMDPQGTRHGVSKVCAGLLVGGDPRQRDWGGPGTGGGVVSAS